MWIGSPFSVMVVSFLMKSVLLSKRMLSSVFSVSLWKGSLRVEWQGGGGGSVAGGVVEVGVEVEDDGCVGFPNSSSFNDVGVVGESVGVCPGGGFVLVEFEAERQKLLLEEGESSGQGVRVSVEGEVVLMNVHSRVWVGVSHLVFQGGYGSVHCQGQDELDMGHPWANPLLVGWVVIPPLSRLHVSSCPSLKRTAHHFHMSLSKSSISLFMAPRSTAP